MKERIYFMLLAFMSVFMAHAALDEFYAKGKILLNEEFDNLNGDIKELLPADMSQFDNPDGWILNDVYVGERCVYIKPGGSITLPAINELTGNAVFDISSELWITEEESKGEPEEEFRTGRYHMSIENGELLTSEFDPGVSMNGSPYMFGVSSETRLTLHADDPIKITNIQINYGTARFKDQYYLAQCDPEAGEYYDAIDVIVTTSQRKGGRYDDDGSHNFTVYTLDGSEPDWSSPRVTGPIHLEENTTLILGTVFGNGALFIDQPRKYEFKTVTAPQAPDETYEISVDSPGQLQKQLKDLEADVIEGLVVKGKINGEDLSYLRSGTGRMGSLTYLNLSEVAFEYDDSEYAQVVFAPEAGMGTTTVIHYMFSKENSDEHLTSSPTQIQIASYRNNLAGAFYKHPTLKHVVLPAIMTTIGENAFSGCQQLEAVTTDGRITDVSANTFYDARNLYYFDMSSVERIGACAFSYSLIRGSADLSKAKEIGAMAFCGTKITSISLGKGTRFGEGAFAGTLIAALDLPSPPDTIPAEAFNCETLRNVYIGEGAKYIGYRAFGNAEDIKLPGTIEELGRDAISDKALAGIEAEDGIKYIGKVAYARVSDQSDFIIKEGTVSLSPGLFQWSNLESVTLPSSLRVIGDYAFCGTKLKRTPDMTGVIRLGDGAFQSISSMTRAALPETLEYLGSQVFYYNPALWKLEYNCIDLKFEWACTNSPVEDIVIGSDVKRIPRGLFIGNNTVTEVQLPASVEIIDDEAFDSCTSLVSVTSSGRIKSIGRNVFYYCRALQAIPALDMDSIPAGTFSGCENLKSVRLSDRVRKIGDSAFSGCSSLTDFHWPLDLEEVEYGAFGSCKSLETVSLPEGVKNVAYNAFGHCESLKNIYIPSTITDFEAGAFTFMNEQMGATVTCMLPETPSIKNASWGYNNRVVLAKVPEASLEAYKAHPEWAFLGDNIVPVEGISASDKAAVTSFGDMVNENSDLSATVIGDVYVTLGEEDGFDAADGAIVLNSTMEDEYAEAICGMAPGASDLHNRFNGLVVKVPAGSGTVVINCQTVGSRLVSVKIGEDEPESFVNDSKGDITAEYDVDADTYVYIYASEASVETQITTRAEDGGDCVRIYSVGVTPENTGVDSIGDGIEGESPIQEYYTLDGVRVENPSRAGIYIGRRADGTTSKVYIR